MDLVINNQSGIYLSLRLSRLASCDVPVYRQLAINDMILVWLWVCILAKETTVHHCSL